MKRQLLFVGALFLATASYAQHIIWPIMGTSLSDFTKNAKIVDLPADKAADFRTEAVEVGTGLVENYNTQDGVTLNLRSKEGDVYYEDETVAADQLLRFKFANNGREAYAVKSIDFDVSASIYYVDLFVSLKLTTDTGEEIMYKNLLPAEQWNTVTKDGTYQHVQLSLPDDLCQKALKSVTLNLIPSRMKSHIDVSFKNVKVDLWPATVTGLNAIASQPTNTDKLHNLSGKSVDSHYKGIVIAKGRKTFQK